MITPKLVVLVTKGVTIYKYSTRSMACQEEILQIFTNFPVFHVPKPEKLQL
jgi:hypothetical protein